MEKVFKFVFLFADNDFHLSSVKLAFLAKRIIYWFLCDEIIIMDFVKYLTKMVRCTSNIISNY